MSAPGEIVQTSSVLAHSISANIHTWPICQISDNMPNSAYMENMDPEKYVIFLPARKTCPFLPICRQMSNKQLGTDRDKKGVHSDVTQISRIRSPEIPSADAHNRRKTTERWTLSARYPQIRSQRRLFSFWLHFLLKVRSLTSFLITSIH